MCNMCLQVPCHPRCPNADEPEAKYTCSKCKYGIYEDEEYFEGSNGPICKECIEEMTVEEVFEMIGEKLSVA